MNKLKTIIATTLLAATVATPVFADGITLKLNNNVLQPAVAPIIENGSTLVPLRIISENLGAKVNWDAATQGVTIQKDDKVISLTLNSKTVSVDGVTKEIAVAPKSISGSTMVPIRFVSENLDCAVSWDAATQTVAISSGQTITAPTAPVTQSKPVEQPKPAAPVYTADGKHQVISDENLPVYYTEKGTKYHDSKDCPTLARSKNIYETTLGKATDSYRDACDKCNAPILDI